ncbi:flavin reductase (NADH) [Arboricoccus pini]|uniref:Flavin reductase (NADH) n=1 Tax=Arboricoccus pini TaxID=1963835 RepID=A0A212QQA2_9PROT|nr:flavin reductase family protein [Arboricoccus pini]SNB61667.1 flavin reductase (NADH) [Arboricoccus pini]
MTTQTLERKTGLLAADKDLFKQVAGHWVSGVAIITTIDAQDRPFGLTMSAVTSLSLDPMQFLIAVDKRSTSLPALHESRKFCINFLSAGQRDVAMRFAGKSQDKFSETPHVRSIDRLPVITGNLATLICDAAEILPGGDHDIIIGDVRHIEVLGGEPMVHFRGAFRDLA